MSTTTVEAVAIDPELAKRLRRDAAMIERWTAAREADIREAHQAGASYREIAELVRLSHVGVMKILRKGSSLATPEVVEDAAYLQVMGMTIEDVRQALIDQGKDSEQ